MNGNWLVVPRHAGKKHILELLKEMHRQALHLRVPRMPLLKNALAGLANF